MNQELMRQAKEEKLVRLSRTDINTFNEFVLKDIKTGLPIKQAAIHLSWQEHIDWCFKNGKKAGILAPWGHGKSSQIIGRILYHIGLNPSIRMKVVCNVGEHAKGRVSTAKNYIEHSKEYQRVFPGVKPNMSDWATQSFTVVRPVASPDSTLEAHGILSTGISGRADMLIVDDPVDQKNAVAEPKKQIQVIDTFYNGWFSRLEPDGNLIYIATRWTMTDLTSELLHNPEYVFLVQAVSKDFTHIVEEVVAG